MNTSAAAMRTNKMYRVTYTNIRYGEFHRWDRFYKSKWWARICAEWFCFHNEYGSAKIYVYKGA